MANLNRRVLKLCNRHGVPLLTRRQWGSTLGHVYALRHIYRHHSLLPNKPVDTLVQHITVTRDEDQTRRTFRLDMQSLERIGQERFGSGISYNFAWDMKTGMIGVGQPLACKGTHTLNEKNVPNFSYDQNAVAIAIAAIGMPGEVPTEKARKILGEFIGILIAANVLTVTFDYMPHSAFAFKDCPTQPVRDIMPLVKRDALDWASKHKS